VNRGSLPRGTVSITGELADVDATTAIDAGHPAEVFLVDSVGGCVRIVVPRSANPHEIGKAHVGLKVRVTCALQELPPQGPGLKLVADSTTLLLTYH